MVGKWHRIRSAFALAREPRDGEIPPAEVLKISAQALLALRVFLDMMRG
jgi:hypothetical protein